MKNLFIITGGPGAGKTTLLNALQADGYPVIPEAARTIIRQESEENGNALPWKNKQLFTDKMITASLSDYHSTVENESNQVCFFDRGVFDAVCYAEMIGYTLTPDTLDKVSQCRYHPLVFILPPWKDIYHTDSERKQTWEEVEYTYFQIKSTYERFGFEVVDVQIGNIEERKAFVLSKISQQSQ